jgi:hypothetical protein
VSIELGYRSGLVMLREGRQLFFKINGSIAKLYLKAKPAVVFYPEAAIYGLFSELD